MEKKIKKIMKNLTKKFIFVSIICFYFLWIYKILNFMDVQPY